MADLRPSQFRCPKCGTIWQYPAAPKPDAKGGDGVCPYCVVDVTA